MSFAPSSVYPITNGGGFREKECGNFFEYTADSDNSEFPHRIWVAHESLIIRGLEQGWRYGLVKKTVAYLVVDEDEYGKFVIEKWSIKNHRTYSN